VNQFTAVSIFNLFRNHQPDQINTDLVVLDHDRKNVNEVIILTNTERYYIHVFTIVA